MFSSIYSVTVYSVIYISTSASSDFLALVSTSSISFSARVGVKDSLLFFRVWNFLESLRQLYLFWRFLTAAFIIMVVDSLDSAVQKWRHLLWKCCCKFPYQFLFLFSIFGQSPCWLFYLSISALILFFHCQLPSDGVDCIILSSIVYSQNIILFRRWLHI